MTSGFPFAKGHGTGNDFIVIPDLDGRLEIGPSLVRALCDRRMGIGGDGILRIVRSAATDDPAATGADIFMDYRNADGSTAQMCGNGIRVFMRYLVESGWADPSGIDIATRGGVRRVTRTTDGLFDVAMGEAVPVEGTASVFVGAMSFPAVGVLMPNPHAVVFLGSLEAAGALLDPPQVTPAAMFPDGVNVEFVHEISRAHLSMRVHERGVGETMSCGTGACAAAWVARRRFPSGDDEVYTVDVRGGSLLVSEHADGMHLTGSAEIVASGVVAPDWLARWE